MIEAAITSTIIETFPSSVESAGKVFFSTPPARLFFFRDVGEQGYHDSVSNLSIPGVFRFNMEISKTIFHRLFPTEVSPPYYIALDTLMPTPSTERFIGSV